ncbi:MAG: hypothetical protein JNK04_17320 [Myxococcales bacterium]|nr:hypothetical protein [Myxococcales bacterium]
MGIEATKVYLRKKRIARKVLLETYTALQRQFGAPPSSDDDDDEWADDEATDEVEVFAFARFDIGLERSNLGLALVFDGDRFRNAPNAVLRDASSCLDMWADLLGGQIDEGEYWGRAETKRDAKASAAKLPVYGPADSLVWLVFDAEGSERGRKIVDKAFAYSGPSSEWAKPPKMCQAEQVLANKIVRVERLSYDVGGKLADRLTYDVAKDGKLRERRRE